MAYQRPMVTVEQNMTVVPTSVERGQPAFIFGPNYELHRYEDASEKEGTKAEEAYTGVSGTFAYPGATDGGSSVDAGYTKLFGENVEVELLDSAVATSYSPGEFKNALCGVLSDLSGLTGGDAPKIKVGSLIKVTLEGGSSGSSSPGGRYSVVTKVIGVEDGYVYVEDEPEIRSDASAMVVDIVDGVEFYRTVDGAEQWEPVSGGVHVTGQLKVLLRYGWDSPEGAYYKAAYADLYIQYREFSTAWADNIHSVSAPAGVAEMLGAVSPDNPLAMGVYMACLNAVSDGGLESAPVYFMATPTDDIDGYNAVLRRASLTDRVYALAPTTRDPDVLKAVENHVNAMSLPDMKQWRISAVSCEIPSEECRLDASMNVQGDAFYAVVSSTGTIKVVQSKDDSDPNTDTSFRSTLVPGDKVHLFGADGKTYDTYEIERVINNYMVKVKEDVSASQTARKIEIYHVLSKSETADKVASASRHFASRRMLNVFPSEIKVNGVTMSGEFAACAVAGLISATEPQQPITNMPVRGIDDVPMIYQWFSSEELDRMAEGGTFIIAQDLPGDVVYVRHQVTTATYEGNLNTQEMSVTKNVDSISYAFADAYRPYYGKYNVEPGLISILENLATTVIDSFSGSTSKYGPQLIADGTEILYVRQNQTAKDHVDVAISLEVPYPCNRIAIVLTV